MRVIISCQHCLRQYEVDSGKNGQMGQCDACKGYFTIRVAEPHGPVEDAISFTNPLEPNYLYLHEAAACLGRNLRDMFDMASERFTTENARLYVATMPRDPSALLDARWQGEFCSQIVKRAFFRRCNQTEQVRWQRLADYFLRIFPEKSRGAQDTLINAFTGFLSVEFDGVSPGEELAVYRPRGPLERWAARRGW